MYWQKPTANLLGSLVRGLENNFIIQGIKDKSIRSVMTQFLLFNLCKTTSAYYLFVDF